MTNQKRVLSAVVSMVAIICVYSPSICMAQAVDNTKMNQRHNAYDEMTADQQGQSEDDLKVTQEIRKAITNEEVLSLYGHNVKVITNGGKVTLKGPVVSKEERQRIKNLASQVVMLDDIQDEMDVVSK